jgi:hypothetical protein
LGDHPTPQLGFKHGPLPGGALAQAVGQNIGVNDVSADNASPFGKLCPRSVIDLKNHRAPASLTAHKPSFQAIKLSMADLEYTLKQGGESTAGKINAKLLIAIRGHRDRGLPADNNNSGHHHRDRYSFGFLKILQPSDSRGYEGDT